MKQNKQDQSSKETNVPKLRVVKAEDVAGLPQQRRESRRNRSHLIEELTRYCDQIDQEIAKILRL